MTTTHEVRCCARCHESYALERMKFCNPDGSDEGREWFCGECGPDEVVLPKSAAVVVRAAIAVVEGYSEKRLGRPARYAELKRAVEGMQKGRKR